MSNNNIIIINYYDVLDDNLEKAKTNETIKQDLKKLFCHHSYRKRYEIDDKFIFYCNFFGLDIEYMKKNTFQ